VYPDPISRATAPSPDWWRDAVFYQIYVRSFADGNGDGVGDLAGIRSRLTYLADLGVDALWITPFFPSPMADHGYDVADPRDVEPVFGDLAEFDALLADAHALGIRVTIDLVPNHSSDQHEWFQAALTAAPGSPERGRYLFRDGRGPDGSEPPNNWPSVFGGPAWTRVPDGQWYLHIFAPEQPDLNFANPEVVADLEETMRFWLDRGVDGFRIDVAHGMAKPDGLPDMVPMEDTGLLADHGPGDLRFDNDAVHVVHRRIRTVLDEYPGTMAVGEVWVSDDDRLAQYVREDELQLAFNFKLLTAEWTADDLRQAVTHSLATVEGTPAPACWVLSNHDRPRHVTRYGGGEIGLRRARAAALLQLALPGAAYLYNGDELGMPDVELPDEALQDPIWERRPHRAGPGRLPDPGPVVGHRAAVRVLRPAGHLAADARGLGRAHGGGADGRPLVVTVAVPECARAAPVGCGVRGRGVELAPGARRLPRVPPFRRAGVPGEPLRRGRAPAGGPGAPGQRRRRRRGHPRRHGGVAAGLRQSGSGSGRGP
jgi:alpha-glucosidase